MYQHWQCSDHVRRRQGRRPKPMRPSSAPSGRLGQRASRSRRAEGKMAGTLHLTAAPSPVRPRTQIIALTAAPSPVRPRTQITGSYRGRREGWKNVRPSRRAEGILSSAPCACVVRFLTPDRAESNTRRHELSADMRKPCLLAQIEEICASRHGRPSESVERAAH